MMRGLPADVMTPKSPPCVKSPLPRLFPGGLKFTLLKRLKNSVRNCSFICSLMVKFLIAPKSVLKNPGARRVFFPEFQNVPMALGANFEVSK